ncbi:FAD-binding domain-containing [Fusarium albosuccineum]|uniref:ferric-chelate reductase (NADPH) n=1 Tax=Fusarium albosuccineum TaxID=1237068 RepID=A0A8H4P7W5_9HYPO|nr:FAD-binding domain-containing [Fusarium albosuccineum]
MDSTDLYGVCTGGIIALLILFSLCRSLILPASKLIRRFFLRQIYFSLLPRWLGGSFRLSRYSGLLIGLFINANICLLAIGVSEKSDFVRRLGRAALINLIPLCAGGRFNAVANILSVRPDSYLLIHKCIGIVFIVEVSLHVILSWTQNEINLDRGSDKAGLIAVCSVGALAITSVPALWRWMYECMSALHLAFAATGVASLRFHLRAGNTLHAPKIYLILAISAFVLIKTIGLLKILFTNISTKFISTACIQQIRHGVEVQVSMPRPLNFHAGQFVYLSIPRLAAFQSHPFQIAWEYLSESGCQVLVFVVQPRHGFTSSLRLATPMTDYVAFIEGPYGSPAVQHEYGTVLLFATGIGIAGQLPYMKEQLRLYREWRTKTRRYVLYWVNEWINEILSWNINYVTAISTPDAKGLES